MSNYPQIGDRVVIFGPVQNYSSTTPEIKGYIYECSLTASCALSNLQATSTDGYNYTFSWENSPYPASAYTLFVYDASGSQVYSRNTTSRSQSIPFTKSGNYTWAVRAEDSNGHVLNETMGALFTVTLPGVDYTPYNLQASATYGLVSLSWSADYGEWFHIVLNYWVENGEERTYSTYVNGKSTSLNVSGLANVSISWKVATVDENGNLLSDYVQGTSFTIPENPYQMLSIWCVNGFAQSFMWPPLVRLMSVLLSDEEYKKASAKVSWGSSIGTIAVYLISPLLISLFGWKSVFIFSAVCGAVMIFVWNRQQRSTVCPQRNWKNSF